MVGTGYLQKDHSTRLNTTFKRHLQQMKAVMKSIWTGEPNEKQREQRDFVLRHVLYQNRPCLLADYVQGHSGAAMRNKSEDVKKLLLKGIQAVVALTTPASGRPTNEHLAVKRILLGSACLHLKKGQFTEAARLLDTSRRAISVSTALAIDELEGPRLQGGSPLHSSSRQASSRPGDWSGARGCSAKHLQQLLKQSRTTTPLLPSPALVSMTCARVHQPRRQE